MFCGAREDSNASIADDSDDDVIDNEEFEVFDDIDDYDSDDTNSFGYYDQLFKEDVKIIAKEEQVLTPSMPLPVVQLLNTLFYSNDLKLIRDLSTGYSPVIMKIFAYFLNCNAFGVTEADEEYENKMLSYEANSDLAKSDTNIADLIRNLNLLYKRYENLSENANQMNGLFPNAHSLNDLMCAIKLMDDSRPEYHIIMQYVMNGDKQIDVKYIFEVDRIGETERFSAHTNTRRMLLFHGTPIYNCYDILRNGLRLNGGRIFFADMPQKSYNYCGPERIRITRSNTYVIIFVCDVAVGEFGSTNHTPNQYRTDVSLFSHCVKYEGRYIREESEFAVIDKAIVYFSEMVDRNRSPGVQYQYPYNEYLISHESQVKLRYMVVLKKD